MAGLVIKPRSRIFHGHDWVYATEVLKAFGNPENGSVVSLRDGRDHFLGSAIYNAKSQIVARRFSRRKQDLDADFFARRIGQAVEYRQTLGLELNCRRLVWSESDGLPGLIVDRYGGTAVIQTLTLAMDQRRELIAEAVIGATGCTVVVARNDAPIRAAEGLPSETVVLAGQPLDEPFEFDLFGVRFDADPFRGQKTGFYLDQVDNYREVAKWANGRRVLDCFANRGAFALVCARAGAADVTAVEISEEAVKGIEALAARNGLPIRAVAANAFDYLKEAEHREETYDLIILDPPSFTRNKGRLADALRGYKEIHLRAAKLLRPGGLLATFTCSHHVDDASFRNTINAAFVDAAASARVRGIFTQATDHPILLAIPETEYLRGFLFQMLPGR
jgi:23S rRNA (cytosine1962-C5)-methyltransferase